MNSNDYDMTLWATAKKLCNGAEPEKSMHIVLGIVFLRYVTDTDNSAGKNAVKDSADAKGYKENIEYNEYFVPNQAQWNFLQSNASKPEIGILIDNAINAIEKLNENLRETFYASYAAHGVDKTALGEFIELTGTIKANKQGSIKEPLAALFEYLLKKFAEEKIAGNHYTPPDLARLLAEMTEPKTGKVYDGCCGTGSTFLQSKNFLKKYRGSTNNVSFYGRDNNAVVLKIARMNLALHNINAGLNDGDTFTNDFYSEFYADFILANPLFNHQDWKGNQLTNNNTFGEPPQGNGDYAWLQYFISKLTNGGTAGIILGNNSLTNSSAQERDIRKNLIEAKLVNCIVALPAHLLYNTDKAVCIWILSKNRTDNKYGNQGNQVLFIDARKSGVNENSRKRMLTDENISFISATYHRWRNINGDYMDLKGFSRAVSIKKIIDNNYSLIPEKYITGKGVKKAIPLSLLIAFLSILYFLFSQKGFFTSKSSLQDTGLTVQPKAVTHSTTPEKKLTKAEKKRVNKEPEREKNSTVINPPAVDTSNEDTEKAVNKSVNPPENETVSKPAEQTAPIKTEAPDEAKPLDGATSYKVISKAYFYDEPDETTRRRAFISHWNNSYANIKASEEKNGFIYVTFTNHLGQTSKGWLRKKDLK